MLKKKKNFSKRKLALLEFNSETAKKHTLYIWCIGVYFQFDEQLNDLCLAFPRHSVKPANTFWQSCLYYTLLQICYGRGASMHKYFSFCQIRKKLRINY